jgi:hypothetical protein
MATLDNQHWYSLSSHRPWEDVASMLLGIVVIIAPAFISGSESTAVVISTGAVGVLIIALAMLEMTNWRRWEEWLEMLCGAWLVAAPFVLGYTGTLRTLHIVVGALVAALAVLELWQDRNRKLES